MMKYLSHLIAPIMILSISSCNYPPAQNNSSKTVQSADSIAVVKDTTSIREKELMKDTLFASYTANISRFDAWKMGDELVEKNITFTKENRLIFKYRNVDFKKPFVRTREECHMMTLCYSFNFGSKPYLFEVDFNEFQDVVFPELRERIENDTLCAVSLFYWSRKSELKKEILGLYGGKYGAYTRTVEYKTTDGVQHIGSDPVPMAKVEKEKYTFKSRPNIVIEFTSCRYLNGNMMGSYKGEHLYGITINYFSKDYHKKMLREEEDQRKKVREEPEKIRKENLTDI